MILDALLTFSGGLGGASGYADSPTTGTQNSTNAIDLGVIDGIPTPANGGGARDIGTGDNPALELSALVTTAFAGGTSLQLELQGAPDDGTGAPGSYTTMWQSEAVVEADLLAGVQIANITVPRPVPGQPMPRFLRMRYVTVGTHTAGALIAQIVLDRDDQVLGSEGQYSGYPAGITVAN
jgi:hypothetical protein